MREAYMAVCVMVGFLVLTPSVQSPKAQTVDRPCESIEAAGICDPYVPGTIINIPGNKPITVLGTWPQGPAEKAGICSGDQILAIDGLSTFDNTTTNRLLKQIAADSPSPIRLEVKRGTETKEVDVGRVRESTLAYLSREKFALIGGLLGFSVP